MVAVRAKLLPLISVASLRRSTAAGWVGCFLRACNLEPLSRLHLYSNSIKRRLQRLRFKKIIDREGRFTCGIGWYSYIVQNFNLH